MSSSTLLAFLLLSGAGTVRRSVNKRASTVGQGDDGVPLPVPIEESNLAMVGSQEDRDNRKMIALNEIAWKGAGEKPGIEVWRIMKFEVIPWGADKDALGSFYEDDAYIVLRTQMVERHLVRDIHFWLGTGAAVDEMATAAIKTIELDSYLDGTATHHREVMREESEEFKGLFPQLKYLKGGVASGFREVTMHEYQKDDYAPALYRVPSKGLTPKSKLRVKQVPVKQSSLNESDTFILDAGMVVYKWDGADATPMAKLRADNVVIKLLTRGGGGKAKREDVSGRLDGQKSASPFWKIIPTEGDVRKASEVTGEEEGVLTEINIGVWEEVNEAGNRFFEKGVEEPELYKTMNKVEDTEMVAEGADIEASMLDTKALMMLVAGPESPELFVWVGAAAPPSAVANAYPNAMAYLGINATTPINFFQEGQTITNKEWNAIFPN